MLKTLISIGKQLGKDRDDWDDLIDFPEVERTMGKENIPLQNMVAEVVFDLDAEDVYVRCERAFDDRSAKALRNIKIKGGNNKSVYACVFAPKSLEQLRKTFFGKPDETAKGEFVQAIEKDAQALKDSALHKALTAIFSLKPVFEAKYLDREKDKITSEKMWAGLNMGKTDRIILLFASIQSKEMGFETPTPIKDLDGFEQFFLPLKKSTPEGKASEPRLCYVTGEKLPDVGEPDFTTRYSINKMFVTTTINYAAHLDSKAFHSNYQVSANAQTALERGSGHILKNLTTKIAGVEHCIIPEFLSFEPEPDLDKLQKIQRRCELLFQTDDWEILTEDIEAEVSSMYWVTFQGFQSDGNYFKTINLIKSVSKLHLNKLITGFRKMDGEWKKQDDFPWREVMSIKDKPPFPFNLRTIYNVIPVRKDVAKNAALIFFKSILENRQVERAQIFGFFTELILCHWHKRYRGYANIFPNDYFDYAARDAVFKYLAILQILKQFNLIKDMENTNQNPAPEKTPAEKSAETQERIDNFFVQMDYDTNQKALFYLGRVLHSVALAQAMKEHSSKPILNKLNFNGIGLKEIERLRLDLTEKTQQYKLHGYTEPLFEKFNQFFKHNGWIMPPQEALFFLLSGYSFPIGSKKPKTETSTSN